ncbi:MAG: response regulator [Verrucomicrobia bacterium]|nr:response regulator [Verrucomicrobiota bacterium]
MNLRILIADDEEISRRIVERQLHDLGHELILANDGEAAWALIQKGLTPDIAILDWNMPGLSGIELCRRLVEFRAARPLYVLMLTGRSGEEPEVQALEAGADSFLTKPTSTAKLQARVRAAERLLARLHEANNKPAPADAPAKAVQPAQPKNPADELADSVSSVLIGPGFQAVTEPAPDLHAALDFGQAVWTALLLPDQGVWVDLIVETTDVSVRPLQTTFLGTATPSSDGPMGPLADVLHIIRSSVCGSLRAKDITTIAPLLYKAMTSRHLATTVGETPAKWKKTFANEAGIALRISAWLTLEPIVRKPLRQIRMRDVLTESLASPINPEIVLVNKGALVTRRIWDLLAEIARSAPPNFGVSCMSPSALGEQFVAD